MSRVSHLLFVLLVGGNLSAAPGPGAAGTFGGKRAIVFGIDGCRSDALKLAVENGSAPNIAALIKQGSVTWNAYAGGKLGTPSQQVTYSGPGWSSILTGTWTNKHGVTSNDFAGRQFSAYPHFFSRIRSTHSAASLSSLVVWSPIDDYIVQDSASSADYRVKSANDVAMVNATVTRVASSDPDVVFIHFDELDHVGHASGYATTVPAYMAAIATIDSQIGQTLAAIAARPQFAQEDWLYLISTDHGGIGTGHGGQTAAERTIFIVGSGGSMPRGVITRESIGHTAIPATVIRHLGLGIPASWGWESDAFQIGAKLRVSTGARSVFLSWSLPVGGIAGLTGFELRRNGQLIASPALTDRQFADTSPGAAGQALEYTVTLAGSNEAPLVAATVAPGETAAGTPPEVHLKFDGNLSDASGRGNDATAEGTATFAAGKSGQALSLDGTHSARIGTVAAGAPADLRFGANTDFTVSFWFKANTPWTTDPGMVSNKNWNRGANQGWVIAGENNGNDWQWNLKGSLLTRRDFDPSTANLAGTAWRLVSVTHDRDGDAVFYHDGIEIGRVSIAGTGDIDTTLPVRIGRDGNNAFPWNQGAFIDDLKVWRRVLSPVEVAAEAGSGNATALFNSWMFDQANLFAYAGSALAAADDPDGDGSDNLLEYAGGTSPFRAKERPLLHIEKVAAGMRVRFTQRDGGGGVHGEDEAYSAARLRYLLEMSDLLDGWDSVDGVAVQQDVASTTGPPNSGTHEVAVDLPSADPKTFCRLRVELP